MISRVQLSRPCSSSPPIRSNLRDGCYCSRSQHLSLRSVGSNTGTDVPVSAYNLSFQLSQHIHSLMHQHPRAAPKRAPSTNSPKINPVTTTSTEQEEVITNRRNDELQDPERRGSATGSIRSEEVSGGTTKSEADKINLIVQVRTSSEITVTTELTRR